MSDENEMKLEYGSTDRIKKLGRQSRMTKPSISLVRARAYTEIYRDNAAMPPILKRAMATSKALDDLVPHIEEGQLLIGSDSSKFKSRELNPELDTTWILMEGGLEEMAHRPVEPVFSTPEEQEEWMNEIVPFWQDKTIMMKTLMDVDPELMPRFTGSGFIEAMFMAGLLGSHGNPDYEFLLQNGLGRLREMAQEKLDAWDMFDPAQAGKNHFYEAIVMEMDAVERFAKKYSDYAAKCADECADEKRRAELLKLSDILTRVPMQAPQTFYEALECWWIFLCVWHLEGNTGTCMSRFDSYMYPFYKKDIDEGRLTYDEAMELIECAWIQLSSIYSIGDKDTEEYLNGNALYFNMNIGGVDKNGNDCTNELSYLCLDALINTHTIQPHMSVRIHPGTPEKFRMKVLDLIQAGMGHPSIYNDTVSKEILLQAGATMQEANDYTCGGCMEVGRRATYWWAPGCWVNLGMCVDMAFTGGKKRETIDGANAGEQLSVDTGNPRNFATFEDFENAVKEHFKCVVKSTLYLDRIIVDKYKDYPVVMQSCMQKAGFERGLPFHEGGCYQSCCPPLDCMGIPDVGNSLAAVKKLVYEDKVLTMDELCKALDANFEGYEDIRQMCLNVPKYGNDDDYVDLITQEFCAWVCDYAHSFPGIMADRDPDQATARARHQVGVAFAPLSGSVAFGKQVGALPSGRKASEPLGDSCAPYMGTEKNGPTAALKSVAKINHYKTNGTITNMYITKDLLGSLEGRNAINNLIQTYFDNGGAHIQFSCTDQKVLIDAQEHPENYPNLLVRVAGYSAYFVDLTKSVQDSIIERTVFSKI